MSEPDDEMKRLAAFGQVVSIPCYRGEDADIDACLNGEHPECDIIRERQMGAAVRRMARRMRQKIEAEFDCVLRGETPPVQ